MRFSRACYDKAHRCPGWAGGGMTYPRSRRFVRKGYQQADGERCANGRITVAPRGAEKNDEHFDGHPGAHPLRFGRCTACDVVTWPVATRWIDPTWLRFAVRRKRGDVVSELRWKLLGR